MNHSTRSVLVAFAGAALVGIGTGTLGGCNAGPPGIGSSRSGRPTSGGPAEVGSISVLDAKVTFYSQTLNGYTNIGMQETGSAFAKSTIVTPLLAQQLTTQEIYLALAPDGSTAPPALVAAQAAEAAAMGRSGEVRHVSVAASQLVEKSVTSCENTLFAAQPAPSGYDWSVYNAENTSGSAQQEDPVGFGTCKETTQWVIAGACNENSVTEYM